MANIEKRGANKYRITVSCGYDNKGKKLRKHKTITLPEDITERQKEKELQKQAILFEKEVEKGNVLDGDKITLSEFIEKWLTAYAEKELAPSTLHVYKMRIRKRIIPALGHIKLSKLQPHHLMEFYNNIADEGVRLDVVYDPTTWFMSYLKDNDRKGLAAKMNVSRHTFKRILDGNPTNIETALKICHYFNVDFKKSFKAANKSQKLSDNTVAHHHRLLSSILTSAVQWQLIETNPASRVKPPEVKKKKIDSYDDLQVLKMFEALENVPLKYKAMIYLVIYSGIRLSEMTGLTWEDLNLEDGAVKIDKQRMYVAEYGIFEKETKTESGERIISLPKVVMELLDKYCKDCIKTRLLVGDKWLGSEPGTSSIFLGKMGRPMFPLYPSKWFNEFLKKNDLPKIVFHGLRHSHASLLIAEGVDIVTVSERMGHSSKTITLNTYSHSVKSKDKIAANKLEKLLDKKEVIQKETTN